MIAYFVHDESKSTDWVVVPDTGCAVVVDAEVLKVFIGPRPDFSTFAGEDCRGTAPEALGTVVATRDHDGDVCVVRADIWPGRLDRYLGGS